MKATANVKDHVDRALSWASAKRDFVNHTSMHWIRRVRGRKS